jgi:hypothetical protein
LAVVSVKGYGELLYIHRCSCLNVPDVWEDIHYGH